MQDKYLSKETSEVIGALEKDARIRCKIKIKQKEQPLSKYIMDLRRKQFDGLMAARQQKRIDQMMEDTKTHIESCNRKALMGVKSQYILVASQKKVIQG